jgi:hypothetical protein
MDSDSTPNAKEPEVGPIAGLICVVYALTVMMLA